MKLSYEVLGKTKTIAADDLMDLVSQFVEATQAQPSDAVTLVRFDGAYDEVEELLESTAASRAEDLAAFEEAVDEYRDLQTEVPVGNEGAGEPLPLPKLF